MLITSAILTVTSTTNIAHTIVTISHLIYYIEFDQCESCIIRRYLHHNVKKPYHEALWHDHNIVASLLQSQ